ncbi:MAG TPA: MaoC/PaaZ C-terminal domain-containing protein [Acidimicrobiales bacterium]|nr:MaoC/PaaZ C-terminal domain-containing protein [Acidimicrobiales bacterium]
MRVVARPSGAGIACTAREVVREAEVRAFAAALGEEPPGDRAPLGFSARLAASAVVPCVERLMRSPAVTGLLQVAHDQRSDRLMGVGERIDVAAEVSDRWAVPGGSLATIAVTLDGEDGPVGRSLVTLLVVGLGSERSRASEGGWASPGRRRTPGPLVPCGTVRLTDDHAAGYARAAGDPNPIHRHAAAARAAGLPGIIVPGLCLLWLSLRRALDHHRADEAAVTRVACRFASTARPGDTVEVQAATTAAADGTALAFRLAGPDGAVLKAGAIDLREGPT